MGGADPPLSPAARNYLASFDAWLRSRTPYARALKDYSLGELLAGSGFNAGEIAEIGGRDRQPRGRLAALLRFLKRGG